MAKKAKQKLITLRWVPRYYFAQWKFAWEVDPKGMSWVRFIESRNVDFDTVAVKVAIDAARYNEIASRARGKFNVPFEIADAIYADAHRIVLWHENWYRLMLIPTEIDEMPGSGMRVEWSWQQALQVLEMIAASKSEFGSIRLQRLGPVSNKAVRLEVFVPPRIEATIRKAIRWPHPSSNDLFEVLVAVYDKGREKTVVGEDIPF